MTEIFETGANDVWTVKPEKGKPHYIPYIEDIVKEIDIDNKKIMIDANGRTSIMMKIDVLIAVSRNV